MPISSMKAGLIAGLLALTVLASGAQAQQTAQARFDVNLRAGPNQGFPVVSALYAGTVFTVLGCLGDFSWCDVQAPPHRGWVLANDLMVVEPNGNQAALNVAGAVIGIGVTTFILNNYWREHYYNRPWYGQSSYWNGRPLPYYGRPGYHPPPPHYRPPPPPAYRPPPPHYRPPPPHHPPPHYGGGYRPPPPPHNGGGHRPPPNNGGGGYRPPPPNTGGNGYNPGQGGRPPMNQGGGGGRPPGPPGPPQAR